MKAQNEILKETEICTLYTKNKPVPFISQSQLLYQNPYPISHSPFYHEIYLCTMYVLLLRVLILPLLSHRKLVSFYTFFHLRDISYKPTLKYQRILTLFKDVLIMNNCKFNARNVNVVGWFQKNNNNSAKIKRVVLVSEENGKG